MKAFALLLIAALLVGCEQNSKPSAGAYQLSTDQSGNAWVLDTRNGELRRCWQGSAGAVAYPPTCYKAFDK
jgi:ABC-type uncharacterized transport system auxiliary subunit